MSDNGSVRKRIAFWIDRHEWIYIHTPAWVDVALCWLCGGHTPIPDQCGIPAHDYCAYCQTATPGKATDG